MKLSEVLRNAVMTANWSSILEKACVDQWFYLLETKGGQQFTFGTIDVIDDDWIHLNPIEDGVGDDYFDGPKRDDAYRVKERGISIRLDAIAWVADGI